MDNIWKQYDIRFTGIDISAEAIESVRANLIKQYGLKLEVHSYVNPCRSNISCYNSLLQSYAKIA